MRCCCSRTRGFEPGETENDPRLAEALAALADVYVNDAFGAAHRAHASTEGVAHRLPGYAGLLLEREVRELTAVRDDPEPPLVVILGGAKVSDKIGVIERFLETADAILIGGAMCFSFFRAQGAVDRRLAGRGGAGVELARAGPSSGRAELGCELRLPVDLVLGESFDAGAERRELDGIDVPGRLDGPRHRHADRERVRGGGRRRGHRVLERPDGRVRAGAVRGRDARRGRGGGRGVRDGPWSAAATRSLP